MKEIRWLKKFVAILCTISLLMGTMGLQVLAETETSQETEKTYTELTFSDYGFADGVVYENPKKNSYNQLRADAFSSMTSMDGVAFTGKYLFAGEVDANYGPRVGWGGSGKAGISIYRSGTQLKFYDLVAGKALGEWTNPDSIKLDTEAVTVRFTFDYDATNSANATCTISINGALCATTTVATATLGTGILVYPAAATDAIASVEPTFTELTFSDYGIANGNVSQDPLYDATSGQIKIENPTAITSLDRSAFTGKVLFSATQGGDGTYGIRIGFRNGIGITRDGSDLVVYHYLRGTAVQLLTIPATTHGVDLDTTAVTVRFAFQYVNDTDFICTISINGTKQVMQYFPSLLSGMGTGILIYPKSADISVESVKVETPVEPEEPVVPEETIKELTFSDFGIVNGTTEVGNQTRGLGATAGITSLDGVTITGHVLLGDGTNAANNCVRVGFGSGVGQGGIGICRAGTNVIFYNYTNNTTQGYGQATKEQHGIDDLDTTAVTVRFVFEYVENTSDVNLTIGINGQTYVTETLTNGQSLLGTDVLIWASDASMTVGSVETEETFKELTFSDYGIVDGVASTHPLLNTSEQVRVETIDKITSMDGVAFTGKIKLADAGTDWSNVNGIRIGFSSGKPGIGVCRNGQQLYFYDYTTDTPTGLGAWVAGDYNVNLDTDAVTVRFAFKYAEDATNVKFTITVNGQEFTPKYDTISVDKLGIGVLVWPNTATDEIASVVLQSMNLYDVYHDVTTGSYPVDYQGLFSVNGVYKQAEESLSATGIYEIQNRVGDMTYTQDVIAYKVGQIHEDGTANDVVALVKAVKAKADSKEDRYVTKAADFDKSGAVDDVDINNLREVLVEKITLDEALGN